jgi:hypothetical protein
MIGIQQNVESTLALIVIGADIALTIEKRKLARVCAGK